MRKVLLATTALVAVAGVTAANADADISITGNYEWEYTTNDAGTTWGDDGHINITAVNAADNGMTWTAKSVLTNSSDAGAQVNAEAAYVRVEGDFGQITLGDMDDSAASAMDGALGRNNDIETQGGLGDADTAIGIGAAADITWMSPSMSGFKVGVSKDLNDADNNADDGKTDVGVTYSVGGASVYYGSADDDRSFGVKGSMAGFTVAIGNSSTSGTTNKANDIAVKYTLANGITIAALSANGTGADGLKDKASNVGLSYSLVPGVKLNAESGKLDENGTSTNYSWVAINMSF
ncbi:MAG: porin [Candidatus Puniceispirillaceae bacterium]